MGKSNKILFMQGNEACAKAAIAAGCRFFAGYPITPSSEIAEHLSRWLPEVGGKFIQMEDEIASMAAVIGASLAGLKAMTATSGPGFSLKQENIGYASLCEIPCVIVNVQRGGPSTGLPTSPAQGDLQQAMWGTHGDHPIIVMTPTYTSEIYTETIRAFNLSEQYRVPVIFLMDEIIAHMREKAEIPAEVEIIDRRTPDVKPEDYKPFDTSFGDVPPMAAFGEGYRFHVTGMVHNESGFQTSDPDSIRSVMKRLIGKIESNADKIAKHTGRYTDDAETLVISFGSTARSVNEAIEELHEGGMKVGAFRPLTIRPFPLSGLNKLLDGGVTKRIIVAELNMGQLLLEIERYVCGRMPVVGLNKFDGTPITPQEVKDKIKEVNE